MPTALFLSPHLDDVAFSCGATLAALSAAGWRCVLATAFTHSVPHPCGFALTCQTDKGLAADVDYMALRRQEDLEFARIAGATELRWGLWAEAPHRGYASAQELFRDFKPSDEVWRELSDWITRLHREFKPDVVFAPQGLGAHVDHRQLILAVRAALPWKAIAWYRDTPYAIRDPQARADASVPQLSSLSVPIARHLDTKLDGCAAYRTQLQFQFGGVAAMRERLSVFAVQEGRSAGLDQPAERFLAPKSLHWLSLEPHAYDQMT